MLFKIILSTRCEHSGASWRAEKNIQNMFWKCFGIEIEKKFISEKNTWSAAPTTAPERRRCKRGRDAAAAAPSAARQVTSRDDRVIVRNMPQNNHATDRSRLLLLGLAAHLHGARLLILRPSLLIACLPCAVLTISMAAALAVSLWVPCLLLRVLPFTTASVSFDGILRLTSVLVLNVSLSFWPSLSSRAFFGAYAAVAPDGATDLQARRVVRGLLSMLRELVAYLLAGVGALAVAVATAWFWLPTLLAAAVLLTPTAVVMLLLSVVSAGLAARALAPSLALFVQLKPLSVALAAAAAACALMSGSILHADFARLLAELAACYLLSLAHAKQLLAAYANRCQADEWRAWCEDAHWALVGFGAPLALAFRSSLHPVVCLAALEAAHASAAVLLHEVGTARRA